MMELKEEFIRSHPKQSFILRYFQAAIHKEPEWSDITKLNMQRFADYLSRRVSPNSARTYLAVMKAFIARYSEEDIIPCANPSVKIKAVPSQHIALTMEELVKIDRYNPISSTERDVINIFMRGCLTGARYSDAIELTRDNIRNGMLTYVSKKTHIETSIPLHAMLRRYIDNPPDKIRCSMTMNRTIKQVCRKVGIDSEVQLFVNGSLRKGRKYEFVTEHTSRRTFCTILATMNVPIEIISKLAGHSNSTITSRHYVTIDTKDVGDNAMNFFNSI